MSRQSKAWIIAAAIGLSVAFPVLILPLLIAGYVWLGGFGPSFTVAAYGVQLRNHNHDNETSLPRSANFAAEEEEITSHIRNIQSHRALEWESTSLSNDEETAWSNLRARLEGLD